MSLLPPGYRPAPRIVPMAIATLAGAAMCVLFAAILFATGALAG